MTSTIFSRASTYSRFNLDAFLSDIQVFVKNYRTRVVQQLDREEKNRPIPFVSFDESKLTRTPEETAWLKDNHERFFKDSPNKIYQKQYFLSDLGYITSMTYSPKGEFIVVGHSTGLIQMRHGHTGTVLATLRNVQFPPRPVYAIEYSRNEERICYAACTDGTIYRIELPSIDTSGQNAAALCIKSDPALEWLNTQFFGSPGVSMSSTPFISQRPPALSFSITADSTKMAVGYADASIKTYDMGTLEVDRIFKVHKLRLQFIPPRLQRLHTEQVCAVRCHDEKPFVFATGAWDNTLRIWDTRCSVGCMMTFEGVNIVSDSIDLNRDQAISGSWQATEALSVWDLVAKKRLNAIRVQNRRPNVDGEYLYACRYWKSSKFNRKGKYAIVGGSGTGCVEVINLHNRYITCSYPAAGNVTAITSYDDRIAFGGTAPVFNLVGFHDPKHEKYIPDEEPEYDYTEHPITLFETTLVSPRSSEYATLGKSKEELDEDEHDIEKRLKAKSTMTDISKEPFPKKSKIATVPPKMPRQ